ncbi:MAG: cystathionine gamma-synthase family protein [Acidilobus sp.]
MPESTDIIKAQYDLAQDPFSAVVPPIYLSVAYSYVSDDEAKLDDRGVVVKYSREENPTLRPFERALAELEGGHEGLAFSSGMSSNATTLMALLRKNVKVLALMEMYSTTIQLLEHMVQLVGGTLKLAFPTTESLVNEMSGERYDLVFIEVMTNPTLKVIDVREVGRLARDQGAKLIVDNTFTTPLLVRPIRHGAQVVIHSATKYLAGHNDVVGGVAVTTSEDFDLLWEWRRVLGTAMSPLEAYLSYRGLKTLPLRFERQSRTAQALAEFLRDNSKVRVVHYPGLKDDPYHEVAERLFERRLYGGVLSFSVKGGVEEAKRVLRSLRLARAAPSLGGTETLVTIPALTAASHIPPEDRKALGIEDSLIRVSVGLEDTDDIVEDFGRALGSLS